MERQLVTYTPDFGIGDRVRYKNKIGRDEGFVTAIHIRGVGVSYSVTWSDKVEIAHYDFELELMEYGT